MELSLFAERLAAFRRKASLSQNQAAEALSVSRQAVSKWESGRAAPSLTCLAALAALYGVTPDELLTGQPAPEAEKTSLLFAPDDPFAERLRALRAERGLSQGALAEALSVSRQSVSKWERGEAEPDAERLVLLSSLLAAPVSLLLPAKPTASSPAPPDGISSAPASGAPTAPEETNEKVSTGDRSAGGVKTPDGYIGSDEREDSARSNGDTEPSVSAETDDSAKPDSAKPDSAKPAEPGEKSRNPVRGEKKPLPSLSSLSSPPQSLGERVRRNLSLYRALLGQKKRPAGKKKTAGGAKCRETEPRAEKKSKKIAFRTIAEPGPNDPACVYVNKEDGKLRTILPFLAAIPVSAAVIALLIKKEYKK